MWPTTGELERSGFSTTTAEYAFPGAVQAQTHAGYNQKPHMADPAPELGLWKPRGVYEHQ
jgi:hypothetical protein